jgi:GNAT superfamily N-acetyltransferase
MASNNNSIKFETYINPYSDEDIDRIEFGDFIVKEEQARAKARVETFWEDFHRNKEEMGEFLQRKYPSRLTDSSEFTEWHDKITNWMPSDAEDWWLGQFENNAALESMPQEWWRLRARSFHVARDTNDQNRPVGALAVTKIYFSERVSLLGGMPYDSPALYEPRGHVVAESRQGQGIGTGLWRTAIRFITMSEERLPSVAITTDQAEARLLKKEGGTNKPSFGDLPRGLGAVGSLNNWLVCWERFEPKLGPERRFCDACPVKHNTAWWFPTHRRPTPEEAMRQQSS